MSQKQPPAWGPPVRVFGGRGPWVCVRAHERPRQGWRWEMFDDEGRWTGSGVALTPGLAAQRALREHRRRLRVHSEQR